MVSCRQGVPSPQSLQLAPFSLLAGPPQLATLRIEPHQVVNQCSNFSVDIGSQFRVASSSRTSVLGKGTVDPLSLKLHFPRLHPRDGVDLVECESAKPPLRWMFARVDTSRK